MLFEAVYGDGWEAGVVNPLTPDAARARDAAGEPYTVVLVLAGRPHAVMDLSWSDGFCRVTRFDAAERTLSRHVLRRTADGDLFLREARTWDGPADVGRHEYPHVAARTTTTYSVSGTRTDVVEPRGDRGSRHESTSTRRPPLLRVPEFGRWRELLRLAGDASADVVDAATHGLPVRTLDEPPWRPPRPLEPDGIEGLFASGTVVEVHGRRLRLSTHDAGSLHLTSALLGRLAEAVSSVAVAHPTRVAVDGPPAAGKTTLADELAVVLRARGRDVIRATIDDFLFPRATRYPRGEFSAEGCYFDTHDYQALNRVLLDPLGPGGDRRVQTAVYDHAADAVLSPPVTTAPAGAVLLFDGVFLLRPELVDRWDLRIFVSTDLDRTVDRAVVRERPVSSRADVERRWRERYIPAQRLYFATVHPADRADIVVHNDDPEHPAWG